MELLPNGRFPLGTCVLILTIFLQFPLNHGKSGMAKIQDAEVYPGRTKGKLKICFSTTGDFSNLEETMKKEGFLKLGLFCIKRGAFILYNRPFFQVESVDEIQVASGQDRCFKPAGVKSAQPIGPIAQPKQASITFYHRPFFASLGKPTSVSVSRSFFSAMKSTVKSLIVIGLDSWEIKTVRGKTFCLKNRAMNKEISPICLLPDFNQTAINKPGISVFSVKKGCTKGKKSILIHLSFCSYWGALPNKKGFGSLIEDVSDKNLAGRSGGGGGMCQASGNVMNVTLTLFKAVLTKQFESPLITLWPGLGKEKWKLELLDAIFDAARLAIPDAAMPDSYVQRIRELFIFMLEKVWSNSTLGGRTSYEPEPLSPVKIGPSGGGDTGDTAAGDQRLHMLTEYDYRGMLYQTEQCLVSLSEDSSQASENYARWATFENAKELDEAVWPGLKRKKEANIVIEMTWLITNMVGGLCHRLFNYAHNYWALYIHIVNNMYLYPILRVWNEKIPNLDIILGGDMDVQYKKIALFTGMTLANSNNLEPFLRPSLGDTTSGSDTPSKPVPPPAEV